MKTETAETFDTHARPPAPLWATLVATFFGAGRLKPGPGTWGSAAAVLIWFALARYIPAARQPGVLLGLAAIAVAIGIPAATRVARASRVKDPQFVVIDEVAGQHITLILPLIPIALPHLAAHMDFSDYAIYAALSLLNWKYLIAGFLLFRLFDIWKPFPIRDLEKIPGGWGIMADDWLAGVYAAILLKVALHFSVL